MEVIHPTYLPFTPDVLLRHFAPIAGQPPAEKHIRHYLDSAARAAAYDRSPPTGSSTQIAAATKLALQLQKDERFWVVSALLGAFYAADRIDRLSALLRTALKKEPPWEGHDTWAEALGKNPRLYFEVSLPSPPKYKDWLAKHLEHRDAKELTGIRERLGWLTWEECEAVTPGTCSWLPGAAPSSHERRGPDGQATS